MRSRRKLFFGFTLLELLFAIGIVAFLAIIAIPSYYHYVRKSHYSEIVESADMYKNSVAYCLGAKSGTYIECDGGGNGIPPNIPAGTGVGGVQSITVTDSVVTIVPRSQNGILPADTYIMTPTFRNGVITWKTTGGACAKNYVSNC